MHFMEIHQISKLIRSKEVSPVELTGQILGRINSHDAQLNSYVCVMAEEAMEAARNAEQEIVDGFWKGPLHGIPVGVKDQFWARGTPTAAGTTVLKNNIAKSDSTVVRRLRENGAILVGKQAMAEAAYGEHHPLLPPVHNPWDASLWAGSSSSGSAAATAAGLCFGAVGTDTGGSIRYPSSVTGLTGMKPTRGRVSTFGLEGSAKGALEHVGPLARSARDCAIILAAISGHDVKDPVSLRDHPTAIIDAGTAPRQVRIGVDSSINQGSDTSTQDVLNQAAHVFGTLGNTIIDVRMPNVSDVVETWRDCCAIDLALAHERTFPRLRNGYGTHVAELLDRGRSLPATELRRIIVAQEIFSGQLAELFGRVDAILVPAMGVAAPSKEKIASLRQSGGWASTMMRHTTPFNASGNPSVVVPGGFSPVGNPIGFQLVGAHREDDFLLRLAHSFQEITDFHTKHPQKFL